MARVHMEFLFECSTRYHTSERSKRMRYLVDTRRDISYLQAAMYYFVYYIHTINVTNEDVFDDYPKICDHFPKISEDFPKLFRKPDEHFRTFSEHFRTFPNGISEDSRGL